MSVPYDQITAADKNVLLSDLLMAAEKVGWAKFQKMVKGDEGSKRIRAVVEELFRYLPGPEGEEPEKEEDLELAKLLAEVHGFCRSYQLELEAYLKYQDDGEIQAGGN